MNRNMISNPPGLPGCTNCSSMLRAAILRKLVLRASVAAMLVTSYCSLAITASASVQDRERLASRWERWLNQEVVHIISDREREVFIQLETEEQRERFAAMFWEMRDPTPGTERNEYREEHQRRLEYADRIFSRGATRRGSLTDRGRIYITLGPPRARHTYPSGGSTYPMELWFYEVDPVLGVPPFFYLIFFQRFGAGEFVLYNPVMDGPGALVVTVNPQMTTDEALRRLDTELARAAYNYLPSGGGYRPDRPSLASLTLLSRIEQIRNVGIDAGYADSILVGEEQVTTEYSFSSANMYNVVLPHLVERGDTYISYAIEFGLDQIVLGRYEDSIYGAFDVDVRLADFDGRTVHSVTEDLEFSFTPRQLEEARLQPLLFEGQTVCVPGRFRLNILLKNKVSREIYLLSEDIVVPASPPDVAGVGQIIPVREFEDLEQRDIISARPFQCADLKLLPNPRRRFARGAPMLFYCQLYLPPERRSESPGAISIRHSVVDASGEERIAGQNSIAKSRFNDTGLFHLFMRLPTAELEPGSHTLELNVDFGGEGESLTATAAFELSATQLPAPTPHGGRRLVRGSAEVLMAQSRMWRLQGDEVRAEAACLSALQVDPSCDECSLELAGLYMEAERFEEALRLLEPLAADDPLNPELLRPIGVSYFNLGRYDRAARFLQRLVTQEPGSTEAFNLLGETFRLLGQHDRAAEAWRCSLDLNPDQPEIQEALQNLER